MSRRKVWNAVCLLLVAGSAVFVLMRHRMLTELRNQSIALRGQAEESQNLQAENERLLTKLQSPPFVVLSQDETRELLRLRGEVAPLRSQLAEAKAEAPPHERWSYVGAQTPEAAVETFLWALANTNFLQATGAMYFEIIGPTSRFTAKALNGQIEDSIRSTLMAAYWITNLHSMELISTAPAGNGDLMLKLWHTTFEGNKRAIFAKVRPIGNEWKLVGRWEILGEDRWGIPRMRYCLPLECSLEEGWPPPDPPQTSKTQSQ